MPDKQLFDLVSFNTEKASAVVITATNDSPAQTVVSLVTPSLPVGTYMLGYMFQITHSAKNQPLYFKTSGTYSDAAYFSNSASDNDELHVNRFYAYPIQWAGGVVTLELDMYKPVGGATVDFVDLVITRVG